MGRAVRFQISFCCDGADTHLAPLHALPLNPFSNKIQKGNMYVPLSRAVGTSKSSCCRAGLLPSMDPVGSQSDMQTSRQATDVEFKQISTSSPTILPIYLYVHLSVKLITPAVTAFYGLGSALHITVRAGNDQGSAMQKQHTCHGGIGLSCPLRLKNMKTENFRISSRWNRGNLLQVAIHLLLQLRLRRKTRWRRRTPQLHNRNQLL